MHVSFMTNLFDLLPMTGQIGALSRDVQGIAIGAAAIDFQYRLVVTISLPNGKNESAASLRC